MWAVAKPESQYSSSPILIAGRVTRVCVLAVVSGDLRPQHIVKVLFGDHDLFTLGQELARAGPGTAEHHELEGEQSGPEEAKQPAQLSERRTESPTEDRVERNGNRQNLLDLITAVL